MTRGPVALTLAAAAGPGAWIAGAPLAAAAGAAVIAIAAVLFVISGEPPAPPAPAASLRPDPAPTRQLQGMLDAIQDPLILIEAGRVAAHNSAARRLLDQELLDRDPRLLLRHPAAAGLLRGQGEAAMLEGFGPPGAAIEMRVRALPDGGRLIRFVDHSALRAAERMRTDFVANASHELRTPIAAIGGFAETLADDEAGGDPATRGRFLGIIAREAQRLERLVEDLLSLSRIEADRFRTPAETVDLAQVAREAVAAAAHEQGERGLSVTTTISDAIVVPGDRAQLSQLVHNLVANALKYGRPETPVVVTLEASDTGVLLRVADEGEGIAPEHLPRLTERFYRVDAGRSRMAGGTGLGLAIVKHIVERHRGQLQIDSEVGRGTIVSVRLPVAG